jgi:hypothetical protein
MIGNTDGALAFQTLLSVLQIGLAIYLGAKGNEITAKNYLELGWRFVEPDSEVTRYARRRWHIFETVKGAAIEPGALAQ